MNEKGDSPNRPYTSALLYHRFFKVDKLDILAGGAGQMNDDENRDCFVACAPRKDMLALVIASEAKQSRCSLHQAKAYCLSLLRHPEFISGSRD